MIRQDVAWLIFFFFYFFSLLRFALSMLHAYACVCMCVCVCIVKYANGDKAHFFFFLRFLERRRWMWSRHERQKVSAPEWILNYSLKVEHRESNFSLTKSSTAGAQSYHFTSSFCDFEKRTEPSSSSSFSKIWIWAVVVVIVYSRTYVTAPSIDGKIWHSHALERHACPFSRRLCTGWNLLDGVYCKNIRKTN